MNLDFIPINDLSRISPNKRDKFIQSVNTLISNGRYLNGENVQEFEARLGRIIEGQQVVSVGSGTAALEIAFKSLELPRETKVALVSNAGAYGSIALLNAGLTPVYVDVREEDALIDVNHLLNIIKNEKPKVVLITHLFGNSVDMNQICDIIANRSILLIEDCAQALGGSSSGKPLGTFGDLSTFSFYPTKNLGAIGDAGAISGKNTSLVNKARRLAQYGWSEKYLVSVPNGTNSRMDEIQAAFINLGLPNLEADNSWRRNFAKKYKEAFADLPISILTNSTDSDVAHLFVLRTNSIEERESLRKYLEANHVGSDVHYPIPDHRQLGFSSIVRPDNLKVTEEMATQIVTIPLFPTLTELELDRVIITVRNFYEQK